MTVKQLKAALEHYPENAVVLVEGYEGGLSDIRNIKETKVKLNHNKEEWLGPHEEGEGGKTEAIVFLRASNTNE